MEKDLVLTSLNKGVVTLTLNKPESRNALSVAMLNRLSDSLAEAQANKQARVVVLAAAGPVFCPGHDLKEMTEARGDADRGRGFFKKTMELCSSVMQQIVNHPLPVVADVRGVATAAGCQLVASCDLAIATNEAKFATPGVNIGLFCSTPMVALSRNVSRKHAMQMLLTGEAVSAADAVRFGLINKAVAADEIDTEIENLTETIISKSAVVLKIGKTAFYQQAEMSLTDAYEYASGVMVENMLERDAEEGINAFIEKRDPEWQDT